MPDRLASPWKLPVLVPLWVIQVVLAILFLAGIPIVRLNASDYYRRPDVDVPYVFLLLSPRFFS